MEITPVPVSSVPERSSGAPAPEPLVRLAPRAREEIPPSRWRISGPMLAAFAALAGVAALVLGCLAFVLSWRAGEDQAAPAPNRAQRALALLAKPTTRRVVLAGAAGRAVLALDRKGRGYLIPEAIALAPPGWTYEAWSTSPAAVHATAIAFFSGPEPAVPLSLPLAAGSRVQVTMERSAGTAKPARSAVLVGRVP